MSDEAIIRSLRERVDYLEEENRQLRDRLKIMPASVPLCFRLTPTEAQLLGVLMEVPRITADRLRTRLYGNEHRSLPLIYVHISHVRTKLWRFGIMVGRMYGLGLYLRPEDKARIRAMAAKEQG